MTEIAEGPTVAESYPRDESPAYIIRHWIKPMVKDAQIERRIYEPPMHTDTFLNYLEFRMNQKSTFTEKIFGKRFIK